MKGVAAGPICPLVGSRQRGHAKPEKRRWDCVGVGVLHGVAPSPPNPLCRRADSPASHCSTGSSPPADPSHLAPFSGWRGQRGGARGGGGNLERFSMGCKEEVGDTKQRPVVRRLWIGSSGQPTSRCHVFPTLSLTSFLHGSSRHIHLGLSEHIRLYRSTTGLASSQPGRFRRPPSTDN
jgi:hypothetical protein